MKRTMLALTLAGTMILSMAACGSPQKTGDSSGMEKGQASEEEAGASDSKEKSGDETYRILLTSYDQSVYPGLELTGLEAAGEEFGMEVVAQSPAVYPDLASQVQIIETAVADGYDAIVVHPVDSEGICDVIQSAADQGVAVIIVDTQVADESGTIGFYGSNNYNLGAEAAEQMATALDGKGQVAILAGNEAAQAHSTRRDGMLDTFQEKYPDIEVVDVQYDNVDALKANQMASAFILTYPDLAGMMCTGEVGLSGIMSAIEEAGKEDAYKIVGIDSGAKTNQVIENGQIVGSVMQSPYQMGYLAGKAAYEYLSTGSKPADYINDTGFFFVTPDNIETENAQNVMYE